MKAKQQPQPQGVHERDGTSQRLGERKSVVALGTVASRFRCMVESSDGTTGVYDVIQSFLSHSRRTVPP